MPKNKFSNSITPGTIGAVAGTMIGTAAAVFLSNKKTRAKVIAGFEDVKKYAQEVLSAMNTSNKLNSKRSTKVEIKGRASKIKRKVSLP